MARTIGAMLLLALLGCDGDGSTAAVDAMASGPDMAAGPDAAGEPDMADEPDAADGPDMADEPDTAAPEPATRNVLLIIADDLGIDHAECYPQADGTIAPTPNLRALCEAGVVFDLAWSMPVCSPTRAATLTGTYPFRNGVFGPVSGDDPGLLPDALTLPLACRPPDRP